MKTFKSLVAAFLLAAAPLAQTADVTIYFDGGKLVLTNDPCVDTGIRAYFRMLDAPDGIMSSLKAGTAISDDGSIHRGVCYGDFPPEPDYFFVVDEDGNYGTVKKPLGV